MADTPKYSSILDEFLDSREPDWKDLGLKDAKDSGNTWLDKTHEEADFSFLEDLVGDSSHHTAVPPTSKGATLTNRLLAQQNASSRMGSAQPANTRNAAVISKSESKSAVGDDDSLLEEVTQSFETAEKNSTVEKRHRSDGEIQRYIKQLLNQGETPNKVAAKLKKLAEIELFNHQMSTNYLQANAGMIGLTYMEPNAHRDMANPQYGRKASKNAGGHPLLNSIREQQMEGLSDIVKSISPGDRVTIRTPQGQERTGRAVMLSSHGGWVLNMGGAHGTPGLADDENIVRVVKKKSKQGGFEEAIDEDITPVVFRKWKDTGDVIAAFPYDLGNDDPKTFQSYERVGQHGAATVEGLRATLPASEAEASALKSELESIGYKLNVLPKWPADAAKARAEKLKAYYAQVPAEEPVQGALFGNEASHQASTSQDCVRQAKAWKSAGITPRAKSVKQIAACTDCSYYKKNGSSKSCGLYGLPVVGNSTELAAVVNRMTAGVPSKSKHAALVQIANRLPEQNIPVKTASQDSPFQRQATFTHERDYGFKEASHFSGAKVQQLHTAGHSLKKIAAAADKRFGALETSKGIREFVATLRKEKGKIVMAKIDAEYLKKIGMHSDAIVGAAKCASCQSHSGKEVRKAAASELITRAPDKFVQATLGTVRSEQKTVTASFDSAKVAKLHAAGHPLQQIVKAANSKYGTAQTSKAVRDWAHNLKNTNTKIALSQVDCTVLNKMGVKLSSKNAIVGAEKCGSCSFRNGMHCGLTGGTLLSFPGMNQMASNKKVAAGAPEDGRSMLNEYDLMGKSAQGDIDMTPPERADIQMNATMDAGEI